MDLLSGLFTSSRPSALGSASGESLPTRRPLSTVAPLTSPAAETLPNVSIQEPQKPISAIPSAFDDFEHCLSYLREYKSDPASSSREVCFAKPYRRIYLY